MRRFAERVAFSGANYAYAANWDADKIIGCDCDPGSAGFDCSRDECPRGDDPMTTGQVDEVQVVTCQMASPMSTAHFTFTLDGRTTVQIPTTAGAMAVKTALTAIAGDVSVVRASVGSDEAFCTAAGQLHSVTFIQRHGDVPALRVNVDVSQTAPGATIVVTDATSALANISVPHPQAAASLYFATAGTKEWAVCSGRGACDEASATCGCYTGFDSSNGFGGVGARGDCGFAASPITSCPGSAVECSGHGTCSGHPSYVCTCDAGFTGGDCALLTCPAGTSWFDAPTATDAAHAEGAECSNRGHCDRESGKCVCLAGFTGQGCERTECPVGPDGQECSAHGRCASMAQFAVEADTNGDPTPFRYGSPAPGLTGTWDSRAVFGCLCDEGFEGHSCALRSCPRGDDPRTPGQRETQRLLCNATSGSFTLTFRGATTAAVAATATPAQLQAALEALSTVDGVLVTCASTASVCSAAINTCLVEFEVPLGDLPPMTVQGTGTHSVTVQSDGTGSTINGTTEWAECANRGICDYASGTCACFTQHGSSDGTNSPGSRGDCGYVEPFVPVQPAANPWALADRMWRLRGSWAAGWTAPAAGVGAAGAQGVGQEALSKWSF